MTSGRRLAVRGATLAFVSLAAGFFATGCTTVRVTATERSSIEQRLIVRSLERAAARLDITPLVGRSVRLELFTLTKDETFAREFLRTRLEGRGVHIVSAPPADLTLRVFTAALAVDTADTLVGLPATQAPVLAVPIPESLCSVGAQSRTRRTAVVCLRHDRSSARTRAGCPGADQMGPDQGPDLHHLHHYRYRQAAAGAVIDNASKSAVT